MGKDAPWKFLTLEERRSKSSDNLQLSLSDFQIC